MSFITLAAGDAKLTIAALGAEARDWSVDGRELLWSGDPAIWNKISPILYPVVGWTRDGARVGGKHYALGLHGFAAKHDFRVEESGPDFARLALRDGPQTRPIYPFAFTLTVEYRLSPDALAIAIEVENPGDAPAPYACGTHPGFRWTSREGALARFGKDERPEVPVITSGGLFSAATRAVPLRERELPLSDALFAVNALCFLNVAGRSLRFEQTDGSAIAMDFPGFDHCALWTRPGAPFLCLEAWTGHGDPEGFTGELYEKPSMRMLAPGARARHEVTYRYCPA